MPLVNKLSELIKLIAIQSTIIVPMAIMGGALAANEFFKALFYIVGILILGIIWRFIASMIGHRRSKQKSGLYTMSSACHSFAVFAQSDYMAPAWNTSLLTFSFVYILIPMIVNGYHRPLMMMTFGIFILIDALVRWQTLGCYAQGPAGLFDILTGLFFGGILGGVWYLLVSLICKNFTFFSQDPSNRLKCEKPSKKKMKCTVYRGGVKTGSVYPGPGLVVNPSRDPNRVLRKQDF